MFESHAYGYALGLNLDPLIFKEVIHIARRVAGGKQYRAVPFFAVVCAYTCDCRLVAVENQPLDTSAEMHLAARGDDGLAHGFYHRGKLVGADMRVGVDEYIFLRAMLMEYLKHFLYRPALFAAGIEFAVGVSAGTALAEAIVGVGVYDSLAVDSCHVASATVYILAAFEYYRLETELDKFKSREQACRTGSDNNHLWCVGHIAIFYWGDGYGRFIDLVDMHGNGEVYSHAPLTGVD